MSLGSTNFEPSHVYRSGCTPKIIAERTKIFEIFTLLGTSHIMPCRQFNSNRVWNVIDKATTSLVDSKLNKQMKDYTNEQTFELLSSIGQILDELVFPKDREEEEEIETNECDIT